MNHCPLSVASRPLSVVSSPLRRVVIPSASLVILSGAKNLRSSLRVNSARNLALGTKELGDSSLRSE